MRLLPGKALPLLTVCRCHVELTQSANGGQLREITALIDSGAIHPVVARVFPFESQQEAMEYVEAGRAKGKVVIQDAVNEDCLA